MASLIKDFKAEYCALNNAIHRCHNPDNLAYKRYGARGITVCEEWRSLADGFPAFLEHIGPRPSASYSLDRIDNSKGYEPGNVRWADRVTQQNNCRKKSQNVTDFGWGIGLSKSRGLGRGKGRRPSALVPYAGRIQTVADWAVELGIKHTTLRQRLERGLTPEQALIPNHSYKLKLNRPIGEEPTPAPELDPEHTALKSAIESAIALLNNALNQHGGTIH